VYTQLVGTQGGDLARPRLPQLPRPERLLHLVLGEGRTDQDPLPQWGVGLFPPFEAGLGPRVGKVDEEDVVQYVFFGGKGCGLNTALITINWLVSLALSILSMGCTSPRCRRGSRSRT
jgi:hypothetical protein